MVLNKAQYYEDVELGDDVGPLEKLIEDGKVAAFCGVWGTAVPNRFTDEAIAKEDRLPGPIVPGIMGMAMMAQLFVQWWPSGTLKHLDVVFRQPVPHALVTISAVVTDKREEAGEHLVDCDVYLSNEESGRLIGGKAVVALPSRQS